MSITVIASLAQSSPELIGKFSASSIDDTPAENSFQNLFADLLTPEPLSQQNPEATAPTQAVAPDSLLINLAQAPLIIDRAASGGTDEFPLATTLMNAQESGMSASGVAAPTPTPATTPTPTPDTATILAQPVIVADSSPPNRNATIAGSTVSEIIRPSRNGDKTPVPTDVAPESDTVNAQIQFAKHNSGIDTQRASESPTLAEVIAREILLEPRSNATGETPAPALSEPARISAGEIAPIGQFGNTSQGAIPSTTLSVIRELEIRAHPASPVWREALSAQVSVLIGQRVQSAEMRVHPPELGPVEIRIFTVDQQTSIVFTAAHEDTRRAIEDALPRLREVLLESGVNLESTSVNRERSSGDSHREAHGGARRDALEQDDKAEDSPTNMTSPRRLEGLIDTFA